MKDGSSRRRLLEVVRRQLVRSCSAGCLSLFLIAASDAGAIAQQPQKQPSSPSSTEFRDVEVLLQQNKLAEARALVEEDLKQHPSSVEGRNLLGIIAANQQDDATALAAFNQALRLDPKSTRTLNNLGNVYVAEKKLDLAERQFRTVLRLDPANRDANYNLGVLLLSKGEAQQAILHFERVRPPNLPTSFNLIRAYLQTKRTADALRMAADISAKNADDVQAHFSLGVLLASEKQYKQAELELGKADALRPGTFEILYNFGQAYLRDGDNQTAELVLNQATKLKPESAETLYLLAQVYENEGRPLDALDLLVRARKIAPDNPDILYLMARISISQNYFEDAIPLLESGVAIAPQRPDLLAALGQSYFMSGKVDQAIEAFKKLVAVDPSARSYAFLGISYRHLGRYEEAKQYFEQGLKLEPHNSSCLFSMGFIAERQGDTATAEATFRQVLKINPDYADALLELANLKIAQRSYPEAAELLKRFVRVSHDPATGYYKLAMVERSLRDTAAAERDIAAFQTLSKDAPAGAYPYEHLFDYLDNRAKLAPSAKEQLDITELTTEIGKHPDQPQDLYLLTEAYLKAGRVDDARNTVAQLDKLNPVDFRTLAGIGVLLARYHLYADAIQHFQAALEASPSSDEVKFNLANAYFRKGLYSDALDTASQVSEEGRKDDAYLALLGDIYAHLGDAAKAAGIFRDAIHRNPDNDQDYLALSLLQLRANDIAGAKRTLLQGQARLPASGKLLWGLGLTSAMEGDTARAADQLERAVEVLPEWPGSYSTLGVFYYQTGQIGKAKDILDRFKNSAAAGALDVNKIEQVLAQAPADTAVNIGPLSMASRAQLLQLALSLADRTL